MKVSGGQARSGQVRLVLIRYTASATECRVQQCVEEFIDYL